MREKGVEFSRFFELFSRLIVFFSDLLEARWWLMIYLLRRISFLRGVCP